MYPRPGLHPYSDVEQRIWLPGWIGIELVWSVTGEAEAGYAGEQLLAGIIENSQTEARAGACAEVDEQQPVKQ